MGYKFSCAANGQEITLQEGESPSSLIGRWTMEVSEEFLDSPCIAPDQQDIIPFADRPYGGIDPFGWMTSEDD